MANKKIAALILSSTLLVSGLYATNTPKAPIQVQAKAEKLVFTGVHYIGFVSSFGKDKTNISNGFETRRNYFQVKAFFNKKDYMRLTLDTKKQDGIWIVKLKYAYLYLHNILPYTSIEIGEIHKPWMDYETHGGWDLKSINKVFYGDKQAANLNGSTGLGFNIKTKTSYFSSELGPYNVEDEKGKNTTPGLGVEYRLTLHTLSTGKKKRKSSLTYFDLSIHGAYNRLDGKRGNKDWNAKAMHAVFNMSKFLLAGQYIISTNDSEEYEGEGYSINSELRPFGSNNYLFARYDKWNQTGKISAGKHDDVTSIIGGVVHKYNKNIKLIISAKDSKYINNNSYNKTNYMLTMAIKY